VCRHGDKEAGILLVSSDFLSSLPKPGVFGLALAADTRRCWCRRRGCRRPRFPLLNANLDDEVIPLSPTLLFCYVLLLHGDPLRVLAKCRELVRDFIFL
jgi:hypothetical protein